MRTAIIDVLGYVAAFWVGFGIFMAAGTVVMITAARRGRPLQTQVRFFAPFAVMALLYEGWLLGLPAATIVIVMGLGLVGMVLDVCRLRFMGRHIETIKEARALRDNLDGDGHA